MAVRRVDDDDVDAGVEQRLGPGKAGLADAGRAGDAQAAVLVLAGLGIGARLLDVLDSDQTDTATVIVDHEQLLDAVLVEQLGRIGHADALARGYQVTRHQLSHGLVGLAGEAHVAVRQDADEPLAFAVDDRDAGDRLGAHQLQRRRQRLVRMDGDGIDHHAGLEALDLAHLVGLRLGRHVLVDDAHAARLGHGNRHVGHGHRVHCRRDQRNAQFDRAGQTGSGSGGGRQYFRARWFEQNVIEGQRFADFHVNPGLALLKVDGAYIHKPARLTSVGLAGRAAKPAHRASRRDCRPNSRASITGQYV